MLRKAMKVARLATGIISPRANTYLNYFAHNRKLPNLREPKSFSEKLLKLKLENYNDNPLVMQCADKIRVRDYVEQCGYGHLLNTLICTFNNPEDLDWKNLPQRFALKLNTGAGYNIICKDKSLLDEREVAVRIRGWKRARPWVEYSERQYRFEPRYLVEEYMEVSGDACSPEDYKIYCFNGKPLAILCIAGRDSCGHPRWGYFMDPEWRFIGDARKYEPVSEEDVAPCPKFLDTALDAAAALSAPFPFVRVDFYFPDPDGMPVFGEMTFTPGGYLRLRGARQREDHGGRATPPRGGVAGALGASQAAHA